MVSHKHQDHDKTAQTRTETRLWRIKAQNRTTARPQQNSLKQDYSKAWTKQSKTGPQQGHDNSSKQDYSKAWTKQFKTGVQQGLDKTVQNRAAARFGKNSAKQDCSKA